MPGERSEDARPQTDLRIRTGAKVLDMESLTGRMGHEVVMQERKLRRRHLAAVFPPHSLVCKVVADDIFVLRVRPVCTPVSAQRAPPDVSLASPELRAHSYSSGSRKFQFNTLRSLKPNLSAPKSGFRIPSSNICFLPERGQSAHSMLTTTGSLS